MPPVTSSPTARTSASLSLCLYSRRFQSSSLLLLYVFSIHPDSTITAREPLAFTLRLNNNVLVRSLFISAQQQLFSLCSRGVSSKLRSETYSSVVRRHNRRIASSSSLYVSRRTYATSNDKSSGNFNGSPFSLSDLAKAFQQMGTASDDSPEVKPTTHHHQGHRASGSFQTTAATTEVDTQPFEIQNYNNTQSSSRGNLSEDGKGFARGTQYKGSAVVNTQFSNPTNAKNTKNYNRGSNAYMKHEASTLSPQQLSASHTSSARSTNSTEENSISIQRTKTVPAQSSSHVLFSSAYADHLASLSDTQLCAEVELQLSCRNMSNMIQCLHEVVVCRVLPSFSAPLSTRTFSEKGEGEEEGKVGLQRALLDGSNSNSGTEVQYGMSFRSPVSPLITPPSSAHDAQQQRHIQRQKHSSTSALRHNHRLLTAFLRVLSLLDVYAMEAEFNAWLRTQPSRARPATTNAVTSSELHFSKHINRNKSSNSDVDAVERQEVSQPHKSVKKNLFDLDDVEVGVRVLQRPFSYLVAQGLLRWLSCTAASMNAATALQTLHLLARQNLTWSDAVLRTLVDTIDVHLTQPLHVAQEQRPFQLEQFSLLLDTMARFQAQQTTVIRMQASLDAASNNISGRGAVSGGSGAPPALSRVVVHTDGVEVESDAISFQGGLFSSAQTRRSSLETHHPVVNAAFFSCVTEALTRQLSRTPEAETTHDDNGQNAAIHADTKQSDADSVSQHPLVPLSASTDPFLRIGNASVLFLTRALSRLHWWSDALMSSLTQPLTSYLQRHGESYAGVVMLVGRKENAVGDPALLYVLQRALLGLLARRSGPEPCASNTFNHKGLDSSSDVHEHEAADISAADALNGRCTHSESEEATGRPVEEEEEERAIDSDDDDDDGMMLFSERADVNTVRGRAAGATTTLAVAERTINKAEKSRNSGNPFDGRRQLPTKKTGPPRRGTSASSPSLSLIDRHSFPTSLESLVRFHVRTLQTMTSQHVTLHGPSQPTVTLTRPLLQTQMWELFALLQQDQQRGIASLDTLATATMAPSQLAQLLHVIISSTSTLLALDAHVPTCTAPPAREGHLDGAENDESSANRRHGTPTTSGAASRVSPLLVELTYAWTCYVAQLRPPPLPPRDGRASTAAADVAMYYRVKNSARWRRVVRVHQQLVDAGLLRRTGTSVQRFQHSSAFGSSAHARAAPTSEMKRESTLRCTTAENREGADDGIYACGPGRYFMPEAIIQEAPRVKAEIEKAKTALQDARRRALHQLEQSASPASSPFASGTTSNVKQSSSRDTTQGVDQRNSAGGTYHELSSDHGSQHNGSQNRRPPRFASASVRGGGRWTLQAEVQAAEERRRATEALLQQPVRTSDVFAKYSKSVSRLL